MTRGAEVVVIGGGVVGASVAWHLARRGCTDVVVLDRGDTPGAGSTGRATGGFRAQFGSEINVRLSLLSRAELLTLGEETGVDPGFVPVGYLFLARYDAQLRMLAEAVEVQRAAGSGDARVVGPEEARELNPAVRDPGAGGTHSPADGQIRPLEILRGFREGAERLGVRFRYGEACAGIEVGDGRATAVATGGARIAAGAVVNAAGPWAAAVAALAGVALPVRPLRRQVAITAPTDALPAGMPLTIFCEDGLHLRVRDGRVLLLRPTPGGEDPFDDGVEEGWLDETVRLARERIPALRRVPIDRDACWGGLYEESPDGHAILGPAPEVPNLFLANGSSGHGVMHAPALGRLVAEMILDGAATSLDVRALRPERFAEGDPVRGATLI
jgi:sarcosine oxidase, subunit beta